MTSTVAVQNSIIGDGMGFRHLRHTRRRAFNLTVVGATVVALVTAGGVALACEHANDPPAAASHETPAPSAAASDVPQSEEPTTEPEAPTTEPNDQTVGPETVPAGQECQGAVWCDDFNGAAGTLAKTWSYYGNNNAGEIARYVDDPKYVSQDGQGHLAIKAIAAGASGQCPAGPCRYHSGQIQSKGQFDVDYGKISARMKLPTGPGIFPAFWMLRTQDSERPWPSGGEIDIMEDFGNREPNKISSGIHAVDNHDGGLYESPDGKAWTDDWHVFAIDKRPGSIKVYIDGKFVWEFKKGDKGEWPFDAKYFILFNMAVGGPAAGTPTDNPDYPAWLIDWVRVDA